MASWKIDNMSLSIITINYNNLEGLKKTAESVLSQTWRDFEWIIVDGGSTDGSKEYIESLARSLSEGTAIDGVQWSVDRFSLPGFTASDMKGVFEESTSFASSPMVSNHSQRMLWCSEPDSGVYNAMNKGIVKASGEYLNFMNSGDCFCENSTLDKVFRQGCDADVLFGDWFIQFSDYSELKKFDIASGIYSLYVNNICHQAMFIRTLILKNKGYDESFSMLADWSRWIELYLADVSFEHIDLPICQYDMSGISNSSNYQLIAEERRRVRNQIPSSVLSTILELHSYAEDRALVRCRYIIEHGGFLLFVLRGLLKLMDKLFLKIDFNVNVIIKDKGIGL